MSHQMEQAGRRLPMSRDARRFDVSWLDRGGCWFEQS